MNDFLQELRTEVNGELGRLDPNSRWGKMISRAADEIERLHAEIAVANEDRDWFRDQHARMSEALRIARAALEETK